MIKKSLIFGVILIAIFVLSGCEKIKEIYGVQPFSQEEYVPSKDIKIKGQNSEETTKLVLPHSESNKREAKAIIVQEKDLVSLKAKAFDPDQDQLNFIYTTPLDKEGKWQTDYGDAGEYTITITASDGTSDVSEDILLIVNKKEEAPVIEEIIPTKKILEAKENSKLEFSAKAFDLNSDPLAYLWMLDNKEVSEENEFVYQIGYDAAGEHTIKVGVSDGVKNARDTWTVNVENVNRKPVLEKIADIEVKETGVVLLEPVATDPDGDSIKISVDSNKFEESNGTFKWKTTYDDAGEYTVKISVSDGIDEVSENIGIKITNVNRAPVIEDILLEK